MRLNKYLARCGIGSRRKCDEIISSKQIAINGSIITDFSYQIKDEDIVLYNGKFIEIEDKSIIYILNKPKGYVCTSNDPQDRLKVIDLIDTNIRLFTIGRLDRDTTGIILLTNDGDIANKLAHPKYCKEKKYFVKTKGKIENKFLKIIKDKYLLKDGTKVKADIKLLSHSGNVYEWNIILEEGKNREIKRIFSEFEAKVTLIHRYSFGGIELNNIQLGKYKKIKPNQLNFYTNK
tara:strand:+ start:1918 stop:2619 length:702 start_codon:yes stop_codon:yes gene_type:complete